MTLSEEVSEKRPAPKRMPREEPVPWTSKHNH
jgi:hypothetical protein